MVSELSQPLDAEDGETLPAAEVPAARPGPASCHAPASRQTAGLPTIALVGGPNAGKSALFNALTGRYVTVSNYPGTTVEVSRGTLHLAGEALAVIDTPGLYSLLPITGEEAMARRILLEETPRAVVHTVDAKSLERLLPLTLQLLEWESPVVLVLNMSDEARRHGIAIDASGLSRALGIPVVETVATTGEGVPRLREVLAGLAAAPPAAPPAAQPPRLRYDADIEAAGAILERHLRGEGLPACWGLHARGLALLLLQGDRALSEALPEGHPARAEAQALLGAGEDGDHAPRWAERIALTRQARARELTARHLRTPEGPARTLADWLGEAAAHPLTGVPLLLAVLYLGLYQFVGVFGAGTVVDWLEAGVFGRWVNPWVNGALATLLPGDAAWAYWGRELIGGEYGVVTLGVTYAAAIVLPIVSLFFLFFSLLEDSGYFPRLAMLVDRLFRGIGLNGRAVIPLVLGFGCDTMATLVTRIQETRRERLITTFLLALVVPCSAQYGVIAGLLARQSQGVLGVSYAFLAWAGLMAGVFLIAGRLVSRVLPGPPADFFMELPPLRWPRPGNVLSKTVARMRWYFAEILPLFVLASVLIWLGRLTRLFDVVIAGMERVVGVLGLPPAAAEAFLYGFFRRDFGAAGLYRLAGEGQLDGIQLLVSSVTLTLFLPCIAQFLVMKKEHGLRISLAMAGVVSLTAFGVGAVLYRVLLLTGAQP